MKKNIGKRVAVTGGHGKVGRVAVPYLKSLGYEVFVIDKDYADTLEEPFIKADITDFGQALDALSSKDMDAYGHPEPKAFDVIVHLASMAHPRMTTDSEEFRVNMLATYNVFESARRLGIKNIVWSASEVALGVPFDKTDPPYFPVDESYRLRGYNAYSLTKVLGEEMAKQFCLNDPQLRITCLRLSNVINTEEYPKFETWQDDPTVRLWNVWTYIDNRDAAQAIECAIRYDKRGKDEFFIGNNETVMRRPTEDLVNQYFPDVEKKRSFEGNEAVISNKKAKDVLGYQPQYPWEEQV
ncbi:epimerase [Flavobacterium akiainvivens]|uniref:Epimerase n=1 Tax=Flavobacterium akiainvivens TaxID=1202724 RepID=A0A0N0RR39_9FLAO|nr:NAD(P)-dependent oxidoreductase [Flavobacterium akiainvivens]KOS08072.1 epimerase [Flavobacterium akiainvivens]SFQ71552.1 Nucleoside-diphosphate-sugar epimerase [Flavobacterium akiainvivens]